MSKMIWFKLYSEFRNDPKVKRLPITERYAFIILLCLASECDTRGIISGLDDDDIAFELEMQVEDWKTLKAKFKAKGFIDFTQSEVLIRNWDKRQYDKPSDHPEATKQRKRLQRERERIAKDQDVTEMSRDVTPMSLSREEEIRSEEIRSDQFLIAKEKKITTPCEIEISLPEEKKEYPTFEKKSKDQNPTPFNPPAPLARNYSQQANDRIMQMRQSEKDKWVQSIFDCRLLSQNDDFVDFIQKVYLPTVPDNRGKKIEITQAQTWIVKGQRDFARRDLVEIQIKAFEKYEQSQTQKQHEPAIAEQVPIISAPVPINVKEYAANLARKSL